MFSKQKNKTKKAYWETMDKMVDSQQDFIMTSQHFCQRRHKYEILRAGYYGEVILIVPATGLKTCRVDW